MASGLKIVKTNGYLKNGEKNNSCELSEAPILHEEWKEENANYAKTVILL